ncbi:MAG: hypothetical protein NTW87_08900 [Planctomycetota bacterium]|nr:hypothetical protein [Planctomycetota bacterium]
MSADLHERLRQFTRTILERRGALVEWPEGADEGWAMLTPELSGRLGGGELLRLTHQPIEGALSANLATDFLERLAPLVEAEPRVAAVQIPEMYLKRAAMDEPVARTFAWLNAKVKVTGTEAQRVEYHEWTFRAAITSEDTWEDVITVTLNSTSGSEVALPDILALMDTQPHTPANAASDTCASATQRAAAHVEERAAAFIGRLESRLRRDRKRLKDYYNALLRETKEGGTNEDAEKAEAKRRVVELELRRKTSELEERYRLQVALTPLTLVRLEMPALAVQCDVFRKQARKQHTLYWNPLLTALEPMRCARCGAGAFAVAFTDDTVEPQCAACGR